MSEFIVNNKGELATPDREQKITIDVTMNRILVLPLEKDEKKESTLILDDATKTQLAYEEAMKEMGLMKAEVKAVGPGIYATETGKLIPVAHSIGDIVYVYSNNFESPIKLNGVVYLIYPERNILAKDKK